MLKNHGRNIDLLFHGLLRVLGENLLLIDLRNGDINDLIDTVWSRNTFRLIVVLTSRRGTLSGQCLHYKIVLKNLRTWYINVSMRHVFDVLLLHSFSTTDMIIF